MHNQVDMGDPQHRDMWEGGDGQHIHMDAIIVGRTTAGMRECNGGLNGCKKHNMMI
jgi:hypothetical protein